MEISQHFLLLLAILVIIGSCSFVAVAGLGARPQQPSTSSNNKLKPRKKPPTAPNKYANDSALLMPANNNNIVASSMQLLHTVFSSYAKEVMPERPLVVSMDILLFKVKATIEKEGIFESVIGLVIEWRDNRMTWNPTDFGNITLLAFDSDKVWLPDIAMTNSVENPYQISKDSRFVVRVNHQGLMRFVPSGTARTWCHLRLQTFPFDMQTCFLEFESWSMDASTMTFDGKSSLIIDSSFDSTQFFLCSYKVKTYYYTYEFSNETFTRVRIDLTVKRKSTFHFINLIFPCVVLSAIQLLVFILSSVNTTVDRIGFATTNMLTLVVFQTIVTEEMPKTSDAVTALTKYITALILISAVGIVESVTVERLLNIKLRPPPRFLILFLKPFPALLREKSRDDIFGALAQQFAQRLKASSKHPQRKASVPVSRSTDTSNFDTFSSSGSSILGSPINRSISFQRAMVNSMSFDDEKYCALSVRTFKKRPPSPPRSRLCRKRILRSIEQQQQQQQQAAAVMMETAANPPPNLTDEDGNDEERNAKLWRAVVFRIDFFTFLACASLVVLVPCALFLPQIFVQHPQCDYLDERYEQK